MSTSTKIKAIVYCRVSSKEQEDTGYSLDAQEKLLTEYGSKNKYTIEKTHRISESASGKYVREKFNQVLEFANKNKIDIILCEKIDRLTRNLKDAATIDDWVKENPNRAVHFVKENFVLNQNTKAHENFIWDMKVAVARFYTNNLSEEVHKGQNEKLAQGWIPMKAKYGYKTVGEKGHKIHILDEVIEKDGQKIITGNALHIKNMFEWYATRDYSIARVEKELYEAS
ncbi:MAG: recombinase family protein, partial [Candidatus Pacebacteria bacterium]|nr:recombinase family protein [Candidatus Paceibacterota bacterium]